MLTVAETAALLRTFDNVLILTHVRPDGDTVGCAAALCAGLRALGKTAYLLPNSELTDTTAPYFAPYAAPDNFKPEKVVSTDIATVGLFPENAKPYIGNIDLAIDHHPSFESFGKENIVRPEAAACGELMYDILVTLGPITPEIALPLYVALSTDTGCFAYNNTSAQTHAVAAALIRTGIDFKTVNGGIPIHADSFGGIGNITGKNDIFCTIFVDFDIFSQFCIIHGNDIAIGKYGNSRFNISKSINAPDLAGGNSGFSPGVVHIKDIAGNDITIAIGFAAYFHDACACGENVSRNNAGIINNNT